MTIAPGFLIKIILTGSLAIGFISAWGQKNIDAASTHNRSNYDIRWVSQYPAVKENTTTEKEERKTQKRKNWFSNLIFGKKPGGLVKPMSIVALNPDKYWVADQGSGSFLHVFEQVGEITQFQNKEIDNIPSMVGSCFITDKKILFTDSKLNQIFQFDPSNEELQILNDSLNLEQPTGIAYSEVTQQIWVVETSAHRIAILNDKGDLIKHIGGRGNMMGKFNFPTYIWIDASGTAYVVDAMNFRVQIFDKDGEFLSSFGEIGDASGYFSRPKGVAADSFGHIYIADALFHVVQIFDRTGQLLYTFGSQGQGKEQFWMPTGIYIDKENFIYIADSYNSRVQVFQLTSGD